LRVRRRRRQQSKMRILIVKVADLGDVLTATPALRSLRRTFPSASITALTSPHCKGLLEGTGFVDEVLAFDKWTAGLPAALALHLRRRGFDAMLLLHHLTTARGIAKYAALSTAVGAPVRAGLDNGRGWFLTHRAPDRGFGVRHEVEYCNDVVGLLGADPDYGPLEFPVTGEERAYAKEVLPPVRPLVAVHPGGGSYSTARRWPAERYYELVQRLLAAGLSPIVVGGPGEESLGRALGAGIDLTGRTTMGQLGAVMEGCDAFVGNDSGVMHIAAAVGTPVVALFGPTNHGAWGPWDPTGRSVVVSADLPCQPCFYRGHDLGTPEGCPNRTCLQLITVEQVVDAVRRSFRVLVGV
jgi:ADP-heptose:LPS heptosyltransferase